MQLDMRRGDPTEVTTIVWRRGCGARAVGYLRELARLVGCVAAAALVVAQVAACGRIGFDGLSGLAGDVPHSDADAGFTGVRAIPEIAFPGSAEGSPTATADLRELYFSSDRPGGQGAQDLWVSTRSSATEPWGAPTPVVEINSASNDRFPEISRDGLTLYFLSSRLPNTGCEGIWQAQRGARADPWSAPVRIDELYFAECKEPGTPAGVPPQMPVTVHGTSKDLVLFTWNGTTWGAPVETTALNSTVDDSSGFFPDDDRLVMYFETRRPGGPGEEDLWMASRADSAADFTTIEPVANVNSSVSDADPWVSPDGRYLLFASHRSGTWQIYEASR